MSLLTGLVAHWTLDESSGSRYDAHGSYDLGEVSGVGRAAGKLGYAAAFPDAETGYLTLSGIDGTDLALGDNDWTVACWVKVGSVGGLLLDWSDQVSVYTDGTSGELIVYCADAEYASGDVSTGAWHHVLVEFRASDNRLRVFLDGTGTTHTSVTPPSGVESLVVGDDVFATGDRWVDSLSVWTRLLTDAERDALHASGSGLDYTGFALAVELAGTVTAASTATGALRVDRALGGTVTAESTVTGALRVERGIGGTVTAESTVTGALRVERAMDVVVQASSSVTGALRVERSLDGAVAADSTVTGALRVDRALGGTVTAASSVTGALRVERSLGGEVAASSTVSGPLRVVRVLESTLAAASTVTGSLRVERPLSGSVVAAATVAGDLTVNAFQALSAVVHGVSTVTGALRVERSLAGTVTGASTVTGALRVDRALGGTVTGASSVTGALRVDLVLDGTASGASTVTGSLRVDRQLSGTVTATATLSGDLWTGMYFEAAVVAVSTVTGSLSVERGLEGTVTASAVVSGALVLGAFEAVYPSASFAPGASGAEQPLADESGEWSPHAGYVIAGFHARATGLLAPVTVQFMASGSVRGTVRLEPDEAGVASGIAWLPDALSPSTLAVRLSGTPSLASGGSIECDAAELMEYRPQIWDQYLVTRFATASGTSQDPQGPDYTQAADIVPGLFAHGAILGEDPALQPDEITTHPLYQAFRRLSRLVRIIPRDALVSYELADGVARLRYRRACAAFGLEDGDPWEDIAPPPHSIASGELVRGETYVVRGTTGAVTYDGTSVAIGSEFEAGASADYTATGDAVPWVLDGIRHEALPEGWSNEWVFFLQTHCSNPSDGSIYKPDIYADFFTFGAAEHFRSPSIPDELYPFLNNAYSFSTPTGDPATSSLAEPIVSELLVNPEAPSAYAYAAGANSGADDLFRASRQVYPRPYEIDTCTLEWDGTDQIVVLTLTERLRAHPNAPAAIDADPDTWSADDLARLDGTHATEPEDYRTDDNAVREYLRFTVGDGAACSFKIGDGGWDNSAAADVDGNTFPNLVAVKLVPEVYEDDNETVELTDTRITADWMQHAALVLDCICEGFVAGVTSAERACRSTADAGLYDYTRESLYYEAFAGRSIAPIGSDVREDHPVGFGPLPNTHIYADTHNRLASAYNLLTRLRLDVPLSWETRTWTYTGTATATLTSPNGYSSGACSGGPRTAWQDGVTCPTAATAASDTGWELWAGPGTPSVLAVYGCGLGCNADATGWAINSYRQEAAWRVSIDPAWLAAIPEHIQDLVDVVGLGTVAVRTETSVIYDRRDEDPRTMCDGLSMGYRWAENRLIDTETCVMQPQGTVTASAPPMGDVAVSQPFAEPCAYESQHLVQYDLVAHPGAYVDVPLEDLA